MRSELQSMTRDDIAAITTSLQRARQAGDAAAIQFWTAALEDVRGLEQSLNDAELTELNDLHDAWVSSVSVRS